MPEEPIHSGSTASLDAPEHPAPPIDAPQAPNGQPAQEEGVAPPPLPPPRRRGGARRSLPDVLVELGFISSERMQEVSAQAGQAGRSVEEILREEGQVSSEQLARATAERFGLDF